MGRSNKLKKGEREPAVYQMLRPFSIVFKGGERACGMPHTTCVDINAKGGNCWNCVIININWDRIAIGLGD